MPLAPAPGIDPGRLEARFVRTRTAPAAVPSGPVATIAEPGRLSGAGEDIDMDRVAELVRAAGVDCVIDTPGGGVAVLLAGPPATEPAWASPWAAQAGPGRFRWDRPSTASTLDLAVGPDDCGQVRPTSVRSVGALTEAQIAALIVAQTRIGDPTAPLSHDELDAIGLDGSAGRG